VNETAGGEREVETGEHAMSGEDAKGLNPSTSRTSETETLQEEIGELKGEIKELKEQIRGYEHKRDAAEPLSQLYNHYDYWVREKGQEKKEKEQRLYQKQDKLEALRYPASDKQGIQALSKQFLAVNLETDVSPPRTMTAGYKTNAWNGIEENMYVERTVAGAIVKSIVATPNRLLLRGAPASGKTSIMGDVFRQLCKFYENTSTKVYYLNATKIPHDEARREVESWIGRQDKIVVLVDDAQRLYGRTSFFELFKGGDSSLIAAASYSPAAMNPDTPINLECFESHIDDDELPRVFAVLGLEDESTETEKTKQLLERWFGRSFGRILLLGGRLLTLWEASRAEDPNETLEHLYYQAATLHKLFQDRVVPELTKALDSQMQALYLGKLDPNAGKKMASYGILQPNGQWTCDYVERFYFSKIFHAEELKENLFSQGQIPTCSKLLYTGLSEIDWKKVQHCRQSSTHGNIPIEDTWQTHFYMGIGKYIPQNMVFGKERASSGGKLDFMLRSGRKLGIELLIESRGVAEHHERFETGGQYADLQLHEFLVCDIVVRDASSEGVPQVVTNSFSKAGEEKRKKVHSVFLVNPALSSGTLYLFAGQQIQKADLLYAA
jgi:hypothetical protein